MAGNVTPRQAALWFAAQGLSGSAAAQRSPRPAPARAAMQLSEPGQAPFAALAPHGLKDATVDLDVIRGWFAEHYWLNFGILTDDLLVIDVDPRNGGDQTWAAISGQPTRALPHTWRVRTGGGGEHILFRNTLGVRCGDLDRGIEIKAKGGYVVGVALQA